MGEVNKTTIQETFTLPSKGLIYDTPINPEITLRSMTTRDEMTRTSGNDDSLKPLCQMIDDCIVGDKPKLSVYDMCLGDYEFLLHKLRIVTYGSDYKMMVRCPNCGETTMATVNLDSETTVDYEEGVKDLLTVHLPYSDVDVELHYQTPRMYDNIRKRVQEIKKKSPDALDPSLPVTLEFLISKVDGKVMNPAKFESWIMSLPLKEYNLLIKTAEKLNRKVGLEPSVIAKCADCGYELVTSFRIGPEFFSPEID